MANNPLKCAKYSPVICQCSIQSFLHTRKKNGHSHSSEYAELEWMLEILLEGANLQISFLSYIRLERNLDIQLGKLREKRGKVGKKPE